MLKKKRLWLARRLWTLRYIKPEMLVHRARRMMFQAALRKGWLDTSDAGKSLNHAAVLARLTDPRFQQAARRLRDLMRSSYSYDFATNKLSFLDNGDVIDLGGIDEIPWTRPAELAPDEINRCFFISFMDEATLYDGAEPSQRLARLAEGIKSLATAAPVTRDTIPIPSQPISLGRRAVNVLTGLALILSDEPGLADDPAVSTCLGQVAGWMTLLKRIREDDLKYNHQTTEIFAQCVWAWVAAPKTLEQRSSELLRYLGEQVGADGYHLERSATYQNHLIGHLDVLLAGEFFARDRLPKLKAIRDTMATASAMMLHPDGTIALFNDCAIGDGPSPAALGIVPLDWAQQGINHLPVAGFHRLDTGVMSALIDLGECGPPEQPGHAHADFLSLELSVGQARFLVDPGTATYKAGALRTWTRTASNHNGPRFDGLEPLDFYAAFRVGQRGRAWPIDVPGITRAAGLATAGRQDGYRRYGGEVARLVETDKDGGLTLIDAFNGIANRQAMCSFLVDGAWDLLSWNETAAHFRLGKGEAEVALAVATARITTITNERYFPFGPKRPTPCTRIDIVADAAQRPDALRSIVTRLQPVQGNTDETHSICAEEMKPKIAALAATL